MHRLLAVQEEERTHIAGELHDRAGQSMTSVLVRLKSMAREAPDEEGRGLVDELRELVTDCMKDIRDIAVAVRPATLDRLGLVSALEQELQTLARRFDLRVDFVAEDASADGLPPDAEIAIFRVLQAALTNVARHAEARAVSVVIQRRDAIVSVIIEDDGVGFDVDVVLAGPVEGRFGLMAMEERLRPFGGTIRFESAPGAGTTVFVEVEASEPTTRPFP
jgi:signal transduction histidine kinase